MFKLEADLTGARGGLARTNTVPISSNQSTEGGVMEPVIVKTKDRRTRNVGGGTE